MKSLRIHLITSVLTLVVSTSVSHAGPFILAGTDADDHGSASGSTNQNGWFFMQRALENIAGQVTNGNKQVVFLGSDIGTTAGNAATSAFTNSSLPGLGWTSTFLNDATIGTFLGGGATGAGILVMDSSDINVWGGATSTERGLFTANAGAINTFLGGGGGLFSQANGYGWVSALVPGLTVFDVGGGGLGDPLSLTALGQTAFPGLTNADLSSGPYHNIFTNPAGLPILATNASGQAVVVGASGGTVTNPTHTVPDSGSLAPVYLLLAGLVFLCRRHMRTA